MDDIYKLLIKVRELYCHNRQQGHTVTAAKSGATLVCLNRKLAEDTKRRLKISNLEPKIIALTGSMEGLRNIGPIAFDNHTIDQLCRFAHCKIEGQGSKIKRQAEQIKRQAEQIKTLANTVEGQIDDLQHCENALLWTQEELGALQESEAGKLTAELEKAGVEIMRLKAEVLRYELLNAEQKF